MLAGSALPYCCTASVSKARQGFCAAARVRKAADPLIFLLLPTKAMFTYTTAASSPPCMMPLLRQATSPILQPAYDAAGGGPPQTESQSTINYASPESQSSISCMWACICTLAISSGCAHNPAAPCTHRCAPSWTESQPAAHTLAHLLIIKVAIR